MSKKYIFGISALTAIGAFLCVFGFAALTDPGFTLFLLFNLPGAVYVLVHLYELNAVACHIQYLQLCGLLFITAGTAALVSAFLLYRHSDKQ